MDAKDLFLRRVDDLHRSINSDDSYELLRAAGIIRQLFLDRDSLFNQVNRKLKSRLFFEVVEHKPPHFLRSATPSIWCVLDSIDPMVAPEHLPRVSKNRDQFLAVTLGLVDGKPYTVRDLVKYVAEVMGGVHRGPPRTGTQRALEKISAVGPFQDGRIPLMHIRSIGRVVLQSLRSTKYLVQGLQRFEDAPGLSIHIALALFEMPDESPNFVLDVGTESDRNRTSLFVDLRGDLNFRYRDQAGSEYLVRTGVADRAFIFGRPFYLVLEIASLENEIMLRIDAGGWHHTHVSSTTGGRTLGQDLHYVLGSDVTGVSHTNIALMEECVYSRCLRPDEHSKLRSYFHERLPTYEKHVRFSGNQFLYSKNHPNFTPENEDDG